MGRCVGKGTDCPPQSPPYYVDLIAALLTKLVQDSRASGFACSAVEKGPGDSDPTHGAVEWING